MAKTKKRRAKAPQSSRPARGGSPTPWSWYANGALKGCRLLRERQWVLAWDDTNTIFLLDLHGVVVARRQAPREIIAVAGAQTGESIVAVSRTGEIWWLDSELEPQIEIGCPFTPLSLAVDPHGQYAVVASEQGKNLVCALTGKKFAQFETNQPLKYLQFVATADLMIGASEGGLITCHNLKGEEFWRTMLHSRIGSMAVDGDGQTILLACFAHGIIRFSGDGEKEGSYRCDGFPSLVAADFEAQSIVLATLEQILVEMNYTGNILGSRALPELAVALDLDALGRYGLVAYGTGELQLFTVPDFFHEIETPTAADVSLGSMARSALPAWETRATLNTAETSSSVIAAVPGTDHLALFTKRQSLRILDGDGELHHETERIVGIGRMLRTAEHWLVAATDAAVLAYDPGRNESTLSRLPLSEISDLQLFGETGDLFVVESREFATRFTLPEQRIWKRQMNHFVDATAAHPNGTIAIVHEDHSLIIYDPLGKAIGKWRAKRPEPMLVAPMHDGWVTSARDARVVRGHDLDGTLLWAFDLAWPPWALRRLGEHVLATSAEGYCVLLDTHGKLVCQNREPRENASYFVQQDGSGARLFKVDQTLIVAGFDGKPIWRHTADQRIGNFAVAAHGVWVFLGKLLCFFPFDG